MAEVHVNKVTKRFGDFTAVAEIDIRFASGEVTCLLGPSGCGKTTLMRIIAGLETPTTGRIRLGERDVTDIPTRRRNIGMVFQYPVMYQTLSVRENIAEPLKRDKAITLAERDSRIDQMLELLDMRDYANAYIEELDAGMRQKVAVGRAIARQTAVVLFDEPTTNVELHAKLQLIRAFKQITSELRQTIIYVTHDQTEAMTLADHIALMKDGEIVQYAAPRELYGSPTTTFGGWFLGNPGMNFMPASLADGKLSSPLLAEPLAVPAGLDSAAKLSIGVRPEQINIGLTAVPGSIAGKLVERTISIGGRELLRVAIGEHVISAKVEVAPALVAGDQIYLTIAREAVAVFADEQRVAL